LNCKNVPRRDALQAHVDRAARRVALLVGREGLETCMLSMTADGNWSSSTARLSSSADGRRTPFICELT
jgi:hypothetical protein